MGYLVVTAVPVVFFGRLGDMFGRVRIYNLEFAVFTVAVIALSFDLFHLGSGALWLIGWRVVQGVGWAMLMASSATILTDAFPSNQRGMALGVNMVAAVAGSFLGLLIGGLLAEWDWRAIFWVGVPIGIFFSLMIVGLANTLPNALSAGLQEQGVSASVAHDVANLLPVGSLFAAFLGCNPIGELLAPGPIRDGVGRGQRGLAHRGL
jgi:MFS family permease